MAVFSWKTTKTCSSSIFFIIYLPLGTAYFYISGHIHLLKHAHWSNWVAGLFLLNYSNPFWSTDESNPRPSNTLTENHLRADLSMLAFMLWSVMFLMVSAVLPELPWKQTGISFSKNFLISFLNFGRLKLKKTLIEKMFQACLDISCNVNYYEAILFTRNSINTLNETSSVVLSWAWCWLIKVLIKKLHSVHCFSNYPAFSFQWMLISVINFPNL